MPKQVTRVAADDALTAIYRFSVEDGEDVVAARLAERLGVAPPSM
jgi:Mn-dependent DtxR family transcriptional regulator